jgi:cytochrome c peroxidase
MTTILYIFNNLLIIIALIISLNGCAHNTNSIDADESLTALNLPETPFDYSTDLPDHFLTNDGGPLPTRITDHDNLPSSNPITDEGATLGRVLFYDVNLSLNRTISCGSCHNSANAFSDEKILSKGFDGGETRRHSMSLLFARYYDRGRFFWDERAETLEDQVLMPIQDEVEMGLT